MVFKVKTRKTKPIPKSYWAERETRELYKKEKGHPSVYQIAEEGARVGTGVPKEIHKEGEWITYKGKIARVERVTKEGTFIRKFKREEGFAIPEKKQTFIKEDDYEKNAKPQFYNFVPIFSWRLPLTIK